MKKAIIMCLILASLLIHNDTKETQKVNVWYFDMKGSRGYPAWVLGYFPIASEDTYTLSFGEGRYVVETQNGVKRILLRKDKVCTLKISNNSLECGEEI